MLRLNQAIGACILASALLPSVHANAATYYVATTGNNSNPGTSSKPWRTVAYAASKMVAGDTTYVNGGVYNEGLIRFGTPGTSSAPIKLLNAPGAFPVIDCVDKAAGKQVLFQNYSGSSKAIGWITFEGFEIKNCYYGIKWYNLHDSTIRRTWVHHTAKSGIQGVGGSKILIDRSRINHTPGHGIYANGTAYAISNSLIYATSGYGIQLNGTVAYVAAEYPGVQFAESHNWIIVNNTFAYSNTQSAMVVWGSRCNNARIENNIFYENGVTMPSYTPQGVNFTSTTCTGIRINNNLAYATGSGASAFLSSAAKEGVHYTQSGNIVNTLNPKFVNAPATMPSSPNFALVSGSPAIDKGLSLSAAKISYPGTTRPKLSTYDVGAYEYDGSSSSLAAPTSLQAVN